MKKRTITYLTDANLITCVIQKDLAGPVLEAAKNVGAQGANRDAQQQDAAPHWRTHTSPTKTAASQQQCGHCNLLNIGGAPFFLR